MRKESKQRKWWSVPGFLQGEVNMNDLQRYLVEGAVEDYEEGRLSRREALKAIAGITGAALAAQLLEARAQVAPAGKPPASSAPLVAPDDPSIVAGIAE